MARVFTHGTCPNPAAELEEWRLILAQFGKKLSKKRYKIINGWVYYNGTIDILTLCWNSDLLVARKKSSLDGKRFKKDKCFEGSRRSAERFAEGNQLASIVYARVDKDKKAYSLFCFLKKKAILLIKEGKSFSEAETWLMDYLKDLELLPTPVGTCQRHVRPVHPGGHVQPNARIVTKPKLQLATSKPILQVKNQLISNLPDTVDVAFQDTG